MIMEDFTVQTEVDTWKIESTGAQNLGAELHTSTLAAIYTVTLAGHS